MSVENRSMKVGALVLFVVVCLATLLALFNFAGGRIRLHQPYTVHALVPDSFNIVLNSDVRRDGIKIGRVRGVEPKGGLSDIKFEIEDKSETPFYKDATVRVRTKTLVGESYLDVDPGKPKAGKLADKATIPVQQAVESVPLERILNTLDPKTRHEVQQDMKGLGRGLKGRGGRLNQLFGALRPTAVDGGKLMDVLEPQKREVAALLDNTGQVLDAFGERTQDAQTFVRAAKFTSEAVRTRDAKLRESFEELPSTLAQANRSVSILANYSTSATPVFRNLKVAATYLSPTLRDLEPAARAGRQLFRVTPSTVRKLQPLLAELRPGADALNTVVRPLDATLRQAIPPLGYIKNYSKELGVFFSNVGAATNAVDAAGHKGRVFGITGPQQYTALPPQAKQLLDAVSGVSGGNALYNVDTENYASPGTLATPRKENKPYPRLQPLGK